MATNASLCGIGIKFFMGAHSTLAGCGEATKLIIVLRNMVPVGHVLNIDMVMVGSIDTTIAAPTNESVS